MISFILTGKKTPQQVESDVANGGWVTWLSDRQCALSFYANCRILRYIYGAELFDVYLDSCSKLGINRQIWLLGHQLMITDIKDSFCLDYRCPTVDGQFCP